MSGILVVAEVRRGELRDVTLELIGAAQSVKDQAGGRLVVAIVAGEPERFAGAVGAAGVDEVLLVNAPAEHFEATAAARALEALVESEAPNVVLLGHTVDSLGFGPAVAARLGLGFASDVVGLDWDDGPVARRGAYADKLVARLAFPGRDCTLLMLRAGGFPPAEPGGAEPPVRSVDVAFDPPAVEHVSFQEVPAGDVDITTADFLLSIGRGVEDRDDLPRFQELAERLGATLSGSRPLVDAGWLSAARQVGQSGRTVKPKVYLALGISGAVQHLAGMRKADTIIAVNTDPEAPIFGVADYGAVMDLFEVAEALERQLR